ncbi:hypothetical protein POX_e06850 [Penicillium oxalicum]|uniref:Uncharacterized protein n=1 Tax=Penicillium oxalicum (strain 114-2 / CGMCC 5302) TaxID=933388 RepID=S7ZBD0_PENO1|nr:hypothetical protein POX_e06850 [Penicillium oxalicum]EPS27870.1 hypothetical protein PDE_02814 [Penicillium oxalicum 114-2]KAI2788829.1 hypothetical protein POX_e06850 [Penicillium oxalicum]
MPIDASGQTVTHEDDKLAQGLCLRFFDEYRIGRSDVPDLGCDDPSSLVSLKTRIQNDNSLRAAALHQMRDCPGLIRPLHSSPALSFFTLTLSSFSLPCPTQGPFFESESA